MKSLMNEHASCPMKYWFVKSGPNTWPWRDPLKPPQQTAEWDEVCKYHGKRNLAMMRMDDKAFFYHSGKEKAVVGIVQVAKEYSPGYTDPTETFGMVDFKVVKSIEEPVMLADIKAQVQLKRMTLVSFTPVGLTG